MASEVNEPLESVALESAAYNIYRGFCEAEGGTEDKFQAAWDKYQDKYGSIECGSEVDDLVFQAMLYALKQYEGRQVLQGAPMLWDSDVLLGLPKGEGVYLKVHPKFNIDWVLSNLPHILLPLPQSILGDLAIYRLNPHNRHEVAEAIAGKLIKKDLKVTRLAEVAGEWVKVLRFDTTYE